jgi:putative redox protein
MSAPLEWVLEQIIDLLHAQRGADVHRPFLARFGPVSFGPERRTPGPSPMGLVRIGLGGCSGYDVVHILERGRQAIEDVTVELEAERAQQDPKVFTRIRMHFVVKGRGLTAEKVERAIALSVEKYCSASAMIVKTATIIHGFEVVDTIATGAGAP